MCRPRAGAPRSSRCARARPTRPGDRWSAPGRSSSVADRGGVEKSSVPPIERGSRPVGRLDPAGTASSLGLAGQASTRCLPPPQMKAVPGIAQDRARGPHRTRSNRSRRGHRHSRSAAVSPQTNDSGKTRSATGTTGTRVRWRRIRCRQPRVQGHRRRQRSGGRHRPRGTEEGREPHVALLDRQEQPPLRHPRSRGPRMERGEVVGPLAAAGRPRSRGPRTDAICSSVVLRRFQRKWPGGLTATMTDRWMRFCVAPRVNHRDAGADALAQEVDALVAERAARRPRDRRPVGPRCIRRGRRRRPGAGLRRTRWASAYARSDSSARKSADCLSTAETSGQSSTVDPSMPR